MADQFCRAVGMKKFQRNADWAKKGNYRLLDFTTTIATLRFLGRAETFPSRIIFRIPFRRGLLTTADRREAGAENSAARKTYGRPGVDNGVCARRGAGAVGRSRRGLARFTAERFSKFD